MKKVIQKLVVTGVAAGAILFASQSIAENSSYIKGNVPSGIENASVAQSGLMQLVNDSTSAWLKFKKSSEEKISKNEKHIADLNESIARESGDQKASAQASINDLKKKNDDLKSQLSAYKDNGKDSFEAFRKKFDDEVNSVTKSLKAIKVG